MWSVTRKYDSQTHVSNNNYINDNNKISIIIIILIGQYDNQQVDILVSITSFIPYLRLESEGTGNWGTTVDESINIILKHSHHGHGTVPRNHILGHSIPNTGTTDLRSSSVFFSLLQASGFGLIIPSHIIIDYRLSIMIIDNLDTSTRVTRYESK